VFEGAFSLSFSPLFPLFCSLEFGATTPQVSRTAFSSNIPTLVPGVPSPVFFSPFSFFPLSDAIAEQNLAGPERSTNSRR